MTKGAVAKESPAKRKSLGKNETPSKQKLLNAVSKTPNSAVKQINTPRSGSKPQANGNASAKKTPTNGLKKAMKVENESEDDDEDDDEVEEDSEGLEEDDSDDGAEEEESGDDEEGEEEEEESDEDDSEDEEDDSTVMETKGKKVGIVKAAAKTEEESDDDDDDDEDDEDEDDDDEDDEDDDDDDDEDDEKEKKVKDSSAEKKTPKKAPKKEKSAAEKAAERECSIFIGNIDFKLTKEDVENYLKEKLSPGDVDHVQFLPKIAGKARGYCFAKLTNKDAVEKAMELNGTEWHGRPIRIGPKTASESDKIKFIRLTNISNQVNDGQVIEMLLSVIKLHEIVSYKRVRSNVFGTHGAVQLQMASEDSYKKIEKLNNKELGNRQIEVLETVKPLKGAKNIIAGKGQSKGEKNQNRSEGNQNKGNQKKGNFQKKNNQGGRYFKKNEGPGNKRPGGKFGGNKFNKKPKKE